MGLGPVGGEGHRQAGLRLGHEEETGGGRSRPRVLRWPTRSWALPCTGAGPDLQASEGWQPRRALA